MKSDGSLSISSDAIRSQRSPIQLVMMPNASGNTSLYMIPKDADSTQTAFLVKPMAGQNWNVGQGSGQPVENTQVILPLQKVAAGSPQFKELPTSIGVVPITYANQTIYTTVTQSIPLVRMTNAGSHSEKQTIVGPFLNKTPICVSFVGTPLLVSTTVATQAGSLREPSYKIPSPSVPSTVTIVNPYVSLGQQTVIAQSATVTSTARTVSNKSLVYSANIGQIPHFSSNIVTKTITVTNSGGTINSNSLKPVCQVNEDRKQLGTSADTSVVKRWYIINGKPYICGERNADGLAILQPFSTSQVSCSTTEASVNAMTPAATTKTSIPLNQSLVDKNIRSPFEKSLVVTMSNSPKITVVPKHSSPVITLNTNGHVEKESNAASSSASMCSLTLPGLPDSLKPISPVLLDDNTRSGSVNSVSSDDIPHPMLLFRHENAKKLKPTQMQQYFDDPFVSKTVTSTTTPVLFTSAANSISGHAVMSSGELVPPYITSSLQEKIKTIWTTPLNSTSVNSDVSSNSKNSSVKTVSVTQTRPSPVKIKMPTVKNVSDRSCSSLSNGSTVGSEKKTVHVPILPMENRTVQPKTTAGVIAGLARKALSDSRERAQKLNGHYHKESPLKETCLKDKSIPKSILVDINEPTCASVLNVSNAKSEDLFNCNEPSSLKISSVFSLCPTEQENKVIPRNRESPSEQTRTPDKQCTAKKQPDITVIDFDSPSKNTRQTTRESTKAMVSLLTQNLKSKLYSKQHSCKTKTTSGKKCRVVLRQLKVNDFKKRYPYIEFRKMTCSKRCREVVANAFFKFVKDSDASIASSMQFNPSVAFSRKGSKVVRINNNKLKREITVSRSTPFHSNGSSNVTISDKTTSISGTALVSTSPVSLPIKLARESDSSRKQDVLKTQEVFHNRAVSPKYVVTDSAHCPTNAVVKVTSKAGTPSESVGRQSSPNPSKFYIYNADSRSVILLDSSQNTFAQACGLSQDISSSVIETTTSVASLNCLTTSNCGLSSVSKPATVPTSAPVVTPVHLSRADTTVIPVSAPAMSIAVSDLSYVRVKPEQSTLGYNDVADASTLSVSKVKSEPLHQGYSDEIDTPFDHSVNPSLDNNRKRKNTSDISQSVEIGYDTEKQNRDTNDLQPFAISETPHTERVRQLKEQLKQKQAALEEVRKKRFLARSESVDSDN